MTDNQSKAVKIVVAQKIVTNLEATNLLGISLGNFNNFIRLRKLYDEKAKEKPREPGFSVTASNYKASINRKYLKMMVAAEWIKAPSSTDVTEQQPIDCGMETATRPVDEMQLDNINQTIKDFRMSTSADAEDRVWPLHAKVHWSAGRSMVQGLKTFSSTHIYQAHLQPDSTLSVETS